MKNVKRCLWTAIYVCFVIIYSVEVVAIPIGSYTNPSVESYFIFPNTDNDNAILPFAFFNNGFALQDATTTCSFYSMFPVSGNILLNGGLLNLIADLYFDSSATYSTCGTINAQKNNIYFSPNVTVIGELNNEAVFVNTHINLMYGVAAGGILRFSGFNCFHGGGNTLDLSTTGSIVVDTGALLYFKDVTITGLRGANISCIDDSGLIIFDNVILQLDDDFTFTLGGMNFCNSCELVGDAVFSYESTISTTISSGASLTLDGGITFSYAPLSGAQDLLVFQDATSQIFLQQATLYAVPTGLLLTRGSMVVGTLACFSACAPGGIIFGSGNQADDFFCTIQAGGELHITTGSLFVHNNVNPTAVSMQPASRLSIFPGAVVTLCTSLNVHDNRVIFYDGAWLQRYSGSTLTANAIPLGSMYTINS